MNLFYCTHLPAHVIYGMPVSIILGIVLTHFMIFGLLFASEGHCESKFGSGKCQEEGGGQWGRA
jgi:hypothetical protein